MKKYLLGVIFTTMTVYSFGQESLSQSMNSFRMAKQQFVTEMDPNLIRVNPFTMNIKFNNLSDKNDVFLAKNIPNETLEISIAEKNIISKVIDNDVFKLNYLTESNYNQVMKSRSKQDFSIHTNPDKKLALEGGFFEKNRRNTYSSMWTFASINYLYCDLVAFMDKDLHSQYHTGTVEGMEITPEFLTGAAIMMQISIANIFLPQIIKNENTLRWVQIASGITMSLIQSATLFAGKPSPYYATFSALEIGATTFIAINALKWKTNSKKKIPVENY